jgi:hypothetical protein
VAGWYPRGAQTTLHCGAALHAGRIGAVDGERQLDRLILDQNQPSIERAGALSLLQTYATPTTPPPAVVKAIAPPLSDPVRAVRVEAARALAGTDLWR